jgi:predicted metal-dependent hydrolase
MSQAPSTTRKPTPVRSVRTRRIAFDYPPEQLKRHYCHDDLIMSHVVTVLSSLFPEGEDFFVRTVRNYRNEVVDPELKSQVAGFIGQEAMHGREHRSFNKRLQALGYPTGAIDRGTGIGLRFGERVLPKAVQLAITASLEHYTATLAEVLLSDPEARAMIDNDEVRSMLLWHALEESEHKAVAFDVFQAVSGSYLVRVGVMQAVTAGFLGAVIGLTFLSMLGDRSTLDVRRLARSLGRLRHSPFLNGKVRRRLLAYNRRHFHPDDLDATQLAAQWRTALFGSGGVLADRLRTADAAATA